MSYTPFHEKFPEIARAETRSFYPVDNPFLNDDEFGLLEMYCDEPGCDCRRVMFSVLSREQEKSVAYIAFGWESDQFYANWFGDDDPDIIRELQGPALNSMSPQSEIAPALLSHVERVLQDAQYVERLKRHYAMFRGTIEEVKKPKRRRKPKQKRRRRR